MKETERVQGQPAPAAAARWAAAWSARSRMTFGPSAKRLVRPDGARARQGASPSCCSPSSASGSASLGPRILGHATDLIFSGLFGRRLAGGTTKAEAVAGLRARGDGTARRHARRGWTSCPARASTSPRSAHVLLLVLAVYVAASLLAWLQGFVLNDVVQSTVRRMRADVEEKINRLPLSYFDKQPRGELLSPGHQRHRQRQPDAPADDEPAARLAAHRGRRAGDDVLDLADAGAGRAGHGAGDDAA